LEDDLDLEELDLEPDADFPGFEGFLGEEKLAEGLIVGNTPLQNARNF
jgi:hypothetical protein